YFQLASLFFTFFGQGMNLHLNRALVAAILIALTLAGCGGSSGGGDNTNFTPAPPTRYLEKPFTSVDIQPDVQYFAGDAATNRPALVMDVYTPAGDTVTDRPVIIIAFGGGFVGGDKATVAPIATDFAQRGYVAAAIDYRTLGREPVDADELVVAALRASHDMFAAVRFFREQALGANTLGTRADAIFVSGVSAGGVMAAGVATTDPNDVFPSQVVRDFYANNGGVFGLPNTNVLTTSNVQGALPISGAVLDLNTIDAQSAPLYAAHEEFDPVVPCNTALEGSSSTGLEVSGSCAMIPVYLAAGATAELFLVEGAVNHVGYTAAEFQAILDGGAALFFNTVINP
ncbi:MAG: alpha/beta hydrolase, partial [Pseudomonadota bacterium]